MEQQNQQPIQEATEIKHPIKTNWKLIAVATIVASLVLLILWYVSFLLEKGVPMPWSKIKPPIPVQQVSNDETENKPQEHDLQNWQTYRNEEFGFEFQYPKEFTEIQGCDPHQFGAKSVIVGSNIMISVEKNTEGISLAEYADRDIQRISDYPEARPIIEFRENTLVGGENAIQVGYRDLNAQGGRYHEFAYVKVGNKIYSLSYVAGGCSFLEKGSQNLFTLDEVLSTFRFVE